MMIIRPAIYAIVIALSLFAGVNVFAQSSQADLASNQAHRTPPSLDPTSYSGGDGHSQDAAVIVLKRTHAEIVTAEFDWIKFYHQDDKVVGQTFAPPQDGKRYEVLTLQSAKGGNSKIWFDVTASAQDSGQSQ
jgi:hypothetical protein